MHALPCHKNLNNPLQQQLLQQKQRVLHRGPNSHHNSSSTGSSRSAGRARAASERAASIPPPAPQLSVIITQRGPFTWASCVSTKPDLKLAVKTAAANIQALWQQQEEQKQQRQQKKQKQEGTGASTPSPQQPQPQQQQQQVFEPDLAIVFASCNYGRQLQDVVAAVRKVAPSVQHVFGCSAYGVSGSSPVGPYEVEGEPGVSLTLVALPGVQLALTHTLRSNLPTEDAPPEDWADLVGMSPLEYLTQSPTPSGPGSEDEEEGEQQDDEQQQEQQRQEQQHKQQQQQQQQEAAAASQQTAPKEPSQGVQATTQQQQEEQQQQGTLQQLPPKQHQQQDPSAGSSSSSSVAENSDQPTASSISTRSDQGTKQDGSAAANVAVSPASVHPAAAARDPSSALSFLVLCDPKFPQVRQLLAGLDFAFPDANKAGVVLSQGQQNRKRLMFAWSAAGGVEAGSGGWRRRRVARRWQQQSEAAAAAGQELTEQQRQLHQARFVDPQQQQQQQQQHQQQTDAVPEAGSNSSSSSSSGSGSGGSKGILSSLFGGWLAGLTDASEQDQQQQQDGSSPSPSSSSATVADAEGDEDDANDPSCGGVFMYGAAVLAVKGPVALEPLTCQGYRIVSDKVWVVGDTSEDGDLILNLVDPDTEGGQGGGGTDSDDDEDDEGEGDSGISPLRGLYDMVQNLPYTEVQGDGEDIGEDETRDLMNKLAVAVAADSWSPVESLTPEQYTVSAISEWWSEGFLQIEGQARPGHRLRFVLRDEEGMRDDLRSRLLGLKRQELAAVMAGRSLTQPLAAMLFSDVGRGSQLYESPHYEAGVVSSFLHVPLCGAAGTGQVSTVNGCGTLYEQTSVVGVWRVLPQPDASSSTSSSGGTNSISGGSTAGSSCTNNGGSSSGGGGSRADGALDETGPMTEGS